jgi:hypothetical protein
MRSSDIERSDPYYHPTLGHAAPGSAVPAIDVSFTGRRLR